MFMLHLIGVIIELLQEYFNSKVSVQQIRCLEEVRTANKENIQHQYNFQQLP